MRPDPKPMKRIVRPAIVKNALILQPACRICGQRAQGVHHVVPRSQGGDDVYENLVPLCGSGTTGCHGHIEARTPGWRSRLRGRLTLDEVRYVTAKKSWAWIGEHYPEVAP